MMTPRAVAQSSAFALLWGGQLVSLAGSSAASFALGLAVFEETGSTFYLALVTAVTTFGSIYLAPICGAIVDHFERRQVALWSNLSLAVLSLMLAWIAHNDIRSWLPLLLALVFLAALFNTALSVTLSASVRELRKEANLTKINGVTSLIESLPLVAGPVLGAAVFALVAPSVVFVTDSLTFLICAACISAVRWEGRQAQPGKKLRPFAGAAGGVQYILQHSGFRQLQLSFAGVNFLNGLAVASTTAFIVSASHQGKAPWNLALSNISGAIGLLVGSSLVIVLAGRFDRRYLICGAVIIGALVGRIGLAVTLVPLAWAASLVVRNGAVQLSNAPLTAVWQESVSRDQQATVFGARRLLGQGPYPIAVILGGLLSDQVLTNESMPVAALRNLGLIDGGPSSSDAALLFLAGCFEVVVGLGLLLSRQVAGVVRAPVDTGDAQRTPTP